MLQKDEIKLLLFQLAEEYAKIAQDFFADNLVSLVLFGSVARGTCGPDSDIDLLVVCKSLPDSRLRRGEQLQQLEQGLEKRIVEIRKMGLSTRISSLAHTTQEASSHPPLYLDMVEDAILLYDKGSFFYNVLDDMRKTMLQLGSKRVWLEDGWYWILKPDYRLGEIIKI